MRENARGWGVVGDLPSDVRERGEPCGTVVWGSIAWQMAIDGEIERGVTADRGNRYGPVKT